MGEKRVVLSENGVRRPSHNKYQLYRVFRLFTKQDIKQGMPQHLKMLKRSLLFYHTKPVLHTVFSLNVTFCHSKLTKNNAKNMLNKTLNVWNKKGVELSLNVIGALAVPYHE
ncbi:hypothetical protein [Confluentibacter sediminis]|uniref:hypothetical protein n=1 Tax=Confluentibacter sediminis TaxID=2219045 RepID=UPI0013A70A60|nr:hypothetical protein [Confluentibacter sediminis]